MSTTVDITDYVAGDSLRLDFIVEQSDGTIFPSLNTCTIAWKLDQVSPLGPGPNFLSKALGSGITLNNPATGSVSVTIHEGEIPALGSMLHSLIVTTAGGDVYTVARGDFVAQANLS